ncbi:alpha/beta hydrolase [Flavobacterium crassostreae]|uniref:Alpha/beta hydrolase n=1 Tax=Flavobacterium crassostreae TaxID=1763534 RepID=A0A1B9EAA8_9FLAO|nr:alpha/beta hydrolase [Flavobacterium crassostreae]OCB78867.1 alpha/beta hydrolase [Flavobacterium crassostreae]
MTTKNTNTTNYTADILGSGFEKLTLLFPDDYEGKVHATLVRRKSNLQTTKAILYIHGFNDYFFQQQMALKFNEQGYHFYALDLRKYGRSLLPHQKLNNVRSLSEYNAEIDTALQIIQSENNQQLILKGHSTGGLIITNYAINHPNSILFDALICNSPFYEFNLNYIERKIGIPLLSFLGKYFPNIAVDAGLSNLYGYSLHQKKHGEWIYSLAWKPHAIPKVNLGFLRAIHLAQNNIQNHPKLGVPMLVLYSSRSIFEKKWSENFLKSDAVLNVKHIEKYAKQINGNVATCEIQNALHDVLLSAKPVRENAYQKIAAWLETLPNTTPKTQ